MADSMQAASFCKNEIERQGIGLRKRTRNLVGCAAIIAIQLAFLGVFAVLRGNGLLCGTLFLLLLTAAVYAWETHALNHDFHDLAVFCSSFRPYVLQTLLAAALDGVVYYFLRRSVDYAVVWLVFGLLMLLLSAVTIFVIGAARTMLYADKK